MGSADALTPHGGRVCVLTCDPFRMTGFSAFGNLRLFSADEGRQSAPRANATFTGDPNEAAEDFFGLGTDAEIRMGFGVEDFALRGEDIGARKGKLPAVFAIDEGDVEQDAAVVALEVERDGPHQAELFGDGAARVGEEREGDGVLAGGEVGLALGLRGNADDQGAALAKRGVEVAPGLKLGDAVRAPATAEEIHDEGSESEQVGGADGAAGEVGQGEFGGGGADGEDAVFAAAAKELLDGALADREAFGLDQVTGLGGDFVELVLKVRHLSQFRWNARWER